MYRKLIPYLLRPTRELFISSGMVLQHPFPILLLLVGFTASINLNNLPAAVYTINICRNVPTNLTVPTSSYILSTITLATTDKITGTIVFSIKSTDTGPGQIQVFNPTRAVGPATVTWTSITTGNPISIGDAISFILPWNYCQCCIFCFLITNI